ncbi:MAG: DUF58 domain-containing protein, partial [Verrucomicrobia bacterium]|nr:DUF58 domain-containing protein [Verrucomicrobiota bacterium]
DAIGLLTFDEQVRDYLPARHRFGHLRRLMLSLETPVSGRATDLAAPLQRVAEIIRKRGLIVLISDFLAPLDRLEKAMVQLAACGHEVIVFQVLDPAEATFQFREPAVFEDLETGRTLMVDPGAVRADYTRRLEEHCAAVRQLCQRLGNTCSRLTTDQPLELALFDFLRARMQRGKAVKRVIRLA